MVFEFFLGVRYFLRPQKERFVSVIGLISSFGVAIGVMALIVVIAVMAGFDQDLKSKIIGAHSHLTVLHPEGFRNFDELSAKALSLPEVEAVSAYVSGQAFLYRGDKVLNLNLRGIDPVREVQVTRLRDYIRGGEVSLPRGGILLGQELAEVLGIGVGDEIVLSSPIIGLNTPFRVSGIFHTGMYDYDLTLGFLNLKDAQEFFGVGSLVTQMGLKLKDPYKAPLVKKQLQKLLPPQFHIRTWMEVNKNFFAALALEKMTMFVILALIVLVASFNIASTLIVMVVEKTKDIGILKAIGATRKSIKKIFTWSGFMIGCAGTIFGIIAGVFLCFLLGRYQWIRLPKDIYYIDRLPVALRWEDVLLIAGCALLISFLSTIYPASKASRLSPVEALRYE